MNTVIKLVLIFFTLSVFAACKATVYTNSIGNTSNTVVKLEDANFKVLGSFVGTATAKRKIINIKEDSGLLVKAKKALLEEAKAAGVELTGARTLINVVVDIVENRRRVTCTMSAEIVEFK